MQLFYAFKGKGITFFESGKTIASTFLIEQYADGKIIAYINLDKPSSFAYSMYDDVSTISGSFCDGTFHSEGQILTINSIYERYSNEYQQHDFIISISHLELVTSKSHQSISRDIFVICNLSFSFLSDFSSSKLKIGFREIILRAMSKYSKTVFDLNVFSTILPTAYLIDNQSDHDTIERLLLVLSVLSGTRINYIANKTIGEETKLILESRIVRSFSSLHSVDVRSEIDLNIILAFVFKSDGQFRSKYINQSIMLSFLDIKSDNGYLETKAIKLVAWFEQIKNIIVKYYPKYKASIFRKKMILVVCKLNCRNEIPYSKLLLLVKCRNSLIHDGDFFTTTATSKERLLFKLSNCTDEYIFLLQMAHILLLRAMNYKGSIKDYRSEFNCQGDFA